MSAHLLKRRQKMKLKTVLVFNAIAALVFGISSVLVPATVGGLMLNTESKYDPYGSIFWSRADWCRFDLLAD